MIEVEFEYDENLDWTGIHPKDKKYSDLWKISNRGWSSERLIEDLENVEKCILGEYIDENGYYVYEIGIENSPGYIDVVNTGPAYVCDTWDAKKEPYLELSLEELKDFLEQMRDFLISVGQ